jgi:hypothetical protein
VKQSIGKENNNQINNFLEDVEMKKMLVLLVMCLMGVIAQASTFIDDFSSGDLSAYTLSVLNQNSTDAAAVSFTSTGGAIQVNKGTSTAGKAEQVVFLRNNSLGVGETLRVNKQAVTKVGTANYYADFGIAICNTADPADKALNVSQDVRKDMMAIYLKATYSNIGYCGYDGTTGTTSLGSSSGVYGGTQAEKDAIYATVTGLYISRTSLTTFDLGYSIGSLDTKAVTFTVTNTDIGNGVGFWGDMRYGTTTYGDLDNLRIVPEPATLVLLGLGGLLLKRRHA